MIATVKNWFLTLDEKILELLLFIAFVLGGVVTRFVREAKIPTFKRILSEIVMSFFVEGLVYAVLVEFFELNNFFVYASASYAGSISSKFLDNLENFVEALLKEIPIKLAELIKTKNNV